MSFAKAFQRAAVKKGIEVNIPTSSEITETNPYEIPMMYRAQISGRCSLQYINRHNDNESDLERWTKEWVNSKSEETQPRYQHSKVEDVLKEGHFFRMKFTFPYRVFTNCGQDSIARPPIDTQGIPFIAGSSIKGLFRRACKQRDQGKSENQKLTHTYCGDKAQLTPGILRFHAAYPVGDWATTIETENPAKDNQAKTTETSKLPKIIDVVHPQQNFQVGVPPRNLDEDPIKRTNANAIISLFKPTLIFEITSQKLLTLDEWKTIKAILMSGLSQRIGGKTSTGYGLAFRSIEPQITVTLKGKGISPVLLSGEPEFRPNVFKATLRSHATRLLAGCTSHQKEVEQKVNKLFGSTNAPSQIEIEWAGKDSSQDSKIYDLNGTLYLTTKDQKNIEFIKQVLKFAFTMAGFGKSWRRVWHQDFYQKTYDKLIGCHWQSDGDWIDDIKTPKELKEFLNKLETLCRNYFPRTSSQPLNKPLDWRETWHRQRVAVYCGVVQTSQAISLFHDPNFKTTPAIGGKKPGKDRPEFVSSVWHRMLPILSNKGLEKEYLEIVTIFHGGVDSYWHKYWEREEVDQLPKFIKELTTDNKLKFIWGTDPTAK